MLYSSFFLPLLSVLPLHHHRPSAVLPPATVGMIRRLIRRRSEPEIWTIGQSLNEGMHGKVTSNDILEVATQLLDQTAV